MQMQNFFLPVLQVVTAAVAVSLCRRKSADFCIHSCKSGFEAAAASRHWSHTGSHFDRRPHLEEVIDRLHPVGSAPVPSCCECDPSPLDFDQKLLGVRRRARYLRLVRPPAPRELRRSRGKRRREAVFRKCVRCLRLLSVPAPICTWWFQTSHLCWSRSRDLFICGSMLLLMLCVNHSVSSSNHYNLHKAITQGFLR